MTTKGIKKEKLNTVGYSVLRKDAIDKVTGATKYIDDLTRKDMLHAATVRAPKPHIKIIGIDAKAALALPGVIAVYTAKDIPGKNIVYMVFMDYPVLADKVAKFPGQPVALVVARTRAIAKKAADLVKINYKELPAVYDAREAMKKNAPKIYGKDNIFKSFVVRKGDAKKAMKKAAVTIERTYSTNYQVHGYLETQGVMAEPGDNGGVTIYASTQCPFYNLDALTKATGLQQNKLRVVQTATGGGFGGKEDVPSILACHAAICTMLTGRPVKLIYDRKEDFQSMSKRHPSYTRIKYGADKKGKIIACEAEYILDGGAYATLTPIVLWRGVVHVAGPYDIPNVYVDGHGVATNRCPCGAMRGFGQPQVNFANETLIEELAEKLGLSPVAIREKNMLRLGSTTMTGHKLKASVGMDETLRRVIAKSGGKKVFAGPAKKRGAKSSAWGLATSYYGVSLGAYGNHLERASAHIQILKDGSVSIGVGNTEMGQGSLTVLSQIAAETLGARYDQVSLLDVDTTRVQDAGPTVASRTTVISGNAIMDGCRKLRAIIDPVARRLLGASTKAKLVPGNGCLMLASNSRKKASFKDVIAACYAERLPMVRQGFYRVEGTTFDEKTGLGACYFTYTFSATSAKVEVDTKTGEVTVLKLVSGHDIGKAVNVQQCEGQIQGGTIQGLGYALTENLVAPEGIQKNPGFTDYIMPTAMDVPLAIEPIIVEAAYDGGPYGAKGLGEPPMLNVAPAIANAIYHATGKRCYDLPMLPERVVAGKN